MRFWLRWILAGVALALLGLSLVVYIVKHREIISVRLDDSTGWPRRFFEKTGYPFIRIEAELGNRRRVDEWSVVGANRDREWFESLGFFISYDQMTPPQDVMHTGEVFEPGPPVREIVMHHPDVPLVWFEYLPDKGILVCPGGWPAEGVSE